MKMTAKDLRETLDILGINGDPNLPEQSLHRWLILLTDFPEMPDKKSLTRASRDKNWLVRLGVTLHPSASDAVLELLSGDSDVDVAGAARLSIAGRNKPSGMR